MSDEPGPSATRDGNGDGETAATSRRRVLAGTAAAGVGALAGCAGTSQAQFVAEVDPARREPLDLAVGYDADLLGWSVDYDQAGIRNDVDRSNAGVLRFPGGTPANFYDWQRDRFLAGPLGRDATAVVDRDAFDERGRYEAALRRFRQFRDRWREQVAAGTDDTYGFEGYLTATRTPDVERVLVLNLATAPGDRDPAAYAAEWVRDLASRGVAVDRFELGNEPYGPAGWFNDLRRPTNYLDAAETVAGVVRSAFPDAEVAVAGAPVGRPGLSTGRTERFRAFDEAVAAADFYDAVSVHRGMRLGYGDDGEPRGDSGQAFRRARARGFRTARNRPAETAEGIAGRFDAPAWLTETGTRASPAYHGTMLQATVAVQHLLSWLDADGTAQVYCNHQLFGNRAGTVLSADGEGRDRFYSPLYHAYAFVNDAVSAATHRLPLSVENVLATASERPPWRGAGFRGLLDADADRLYCPFVNRTGSVQQFELSFEGVEPSAARGAMRFVTASPDSKNTAENPRAVTPAHRSFKLDRPVKLPEYATGAFAVDL